MSGNVLVVMLLMCMSCMCWFVGSAMYMFLMGSIGLPVSVSTPPSLRVMISYPCRVVNWSSSVVNETVYRLVGVEWLVVFSRAVRGVVENNKQSMRPIIMSGFLCMKSLPPII